MMTRRSSVASAPAHTGFEPSPQVQRELPELWNVALGPERYLHTPLPFSTLTPLMNVLATSPLRSIWKSYEETVLACASDMARPLNDVGVMLSPEPPPTYPAEKDPCPMSTTCAEPCGDAARLRMPLT